MTTSVNNSKDLSGRDLFVQTEKCNLLLNLKNLKTDVSRIFQPQTCMIIYLSFSCSQIDLKCEASNRGINKRY